MNSRADNSQVELAHERPYVDIQDPLITNLAVIRKDELANIQSRIGVGLARIIKAKNLTSKPGQLHFNYKQNEDRD